MDGYHHPSTVMIIFLNTTERHVMNDEDLRDLFAAFAMLGQIVKGVTLDPYIAYDVADSMIEAKYYEVPEEPEEGITAIKPKRKVK
jgi:hypothetical protein